MATLQSALSLAAKGVAVFPCKPDPRLTFLERASARLILVEACEIEILKEAGAGRESKIRRTTFVETALHRDAPQVGERV